MELPSKEITTLSALCAQMAAPDWFSIEASSTMRTTSASFGASMMICPLSWPLSL